MQVFHVWPSNPSQHKFGDVHSLPANEIQAPLKSPFTRSLHHLTSLPYQHVYPLSLLCAHSCFDITFFKFLFYLLIYLFFISIFFFSNTFLTIIGVCCVSEVTPSILPLTFMLILYPFTFHYIHYFPFYPLITRLLHSGVGTHIPGIPYMHTKVILLCTQNLKITVYHASLRWPGL